MFVSTNPCHQHGLVSTGSCHQADINVSATQCWQTVRVQWRSVHLMGHLMRVTCWHVCLTATLSRVTRGLKMMDTSCTLAQSSLLLRVTTNSSVQQVATSPHRAMLLKPSTIWLSLSVRDTRINAARQLLCEVGIVFSLSVSEFVCGCLSVRATIVENYESESDLSWCGYVNWSTIEVI